MGEDEIKGAVFFCWSADQDWRHKNNNGAVMLHLQGVHVGKTHGVTACGISTMGYWDFNIMEGDAAKWQGCKRCMTALRKHREAQAQ